MIEIEFYCEDCDFCYKIETDACFILYKDGEEGRVSLHQVTIRQALTMFLDALSIEDLTFFVSKLNQQQIKRSMN